MSYQLTDPRTREPWAVITRDEALARLVAEGATPDGAAETLRKLDIGAATAVTRGTVRLQVIR